MLGNKMKGDPTKLLTSLLQFNATMLNETNPDDIAKLLESTMFVNETDTKSLTKLIKQTMTAMNDTDPTDISSLLNSTLHMNNETDAKELLHLFNTSLLDDEIDPELIASLFNSSALDGIDPKILATILNLTSSNETESLLESLPGLSSNSDYISSFFNDMDSNDDPMSDIGSKMGSLFGTFLSNLPSDDTGVDSQFNFGTFINATNNKKRIF
jgi:hypothetical protein